MQLSHKYNIQKIFFSYLEVQEVLDSPCLVVLHFDLVQKLVVYLDLVPLFCLEISSIYGLEQVGS